MSIRKSVVLIICLFVPTSLFAQTWTAGNFEIHVFQVGQADSQLIVGPTGRTLLIDVGERSWNSTQGARAVAQKIHDVMGASYNRLDYIVATHLHADHIGYAERGGIWALIQTHGFTVGTLIDRDSGVWTDANGNNTFDTGEIVWRNAGRTSGTGNNWLPYATQLNRVTAIVGSTAQINLGTGVTVTVVESDAQGVMMEDGQTAVAGNHTGMTNPPSENDYSITLKVSFGSLDYVTGGDTDGAYDTSDWGYTYNNVETVIAPRIGQVEILRANHHGSEHSTHQEYVDTLDPEVSIISCGPNGYEHPGQAVLDRLSATSTVYLTEHGDPNRNYNNVTVVDDDIVIRSSNGVNYTVNGNTYVASDPPPALPLKQQILNQIAVLERELAALRALAQQLPD
jgi:beta-lactamase superfamily II metal-dependent hydrolase